MLREVGFFQVGASSESFSKGFVGWLQGLWGLAHGFGHFGSSKGHDLLLGNESCVEAIRNPFKKSLGV